MKEELLSIWHFIKLAHRIHPGYIPLAALGAALDAARPFLGIVMPRYILNELMGAGRRDRLILYVCVLIAGNAVLGFAGSIIRKRQQTAGEKLADGFELYVGRHIMDMDFGMLEDAKILDMKEKALFNIRLHDALLGGPRTIADIFRLAVTLMGMIGIIAVLNPVLVAALFLLIAGNVLVYGRIQKTKFRFYQDIAVYNRQAMYFRELTRDFRNAKDVRIYRMADYILERVNRYEASVDGIFYKMFLKQRHHDGISGVIIQAQTLAAYAFAAWGVLRRSLTVGDFTMYVSAANRLSGAATQLMTKFLDLRMLGKALEDYLAFQSLPSGRSEGERTSGDIDSVKIEFRHVWFKYPHGEEYALRDVSLTINSGEKLAIVGRNGAGKTTFIKLLCRLYRPEKGCILLNGVDINEFQEEEYGRLLSVLFQDYKIFSFSVGENLAFEEAADEGRIRASLERAGILKKVQELPLGIHTPLYKNFDKDGAELSGGEMQKIAIARVLYRNAPLVVLDEPSAALDPRSEYELYTQFAEMTEGRTTLYISHRLSSCRFCDAIAVFDNGALVEYGSHERLAGSGGLYAEMWEAQAGYYQ